MKEMEKICFDDFDWEESEPIQIVDTLQIGNKVYIYQKNNPTNRTNSGIIADIKLDYKNSEYYYLYEVLLDHSYNLKYFLEDEIRIYE